MARWRGPSRTAVLPGPAARATAAPSSTVVPALTTPSRRCAGDPGRVRGPHDRPRLTDLRDGAAIGAASMNEVQDNEKE